MNLSPHFALDEFLRSDVAARRDIDMTPPPRVVEALRSLCVFVLEPLRNMVGPVTVSSGYRPASLNSIIGGSYRSQHILGEAADISCARPADALFDTIVRSDLPYDQVILEFGWVHVSHSLMERPRRQALIAKRVGASIVYEPRRP